MKHLSLLICFFIYQSLAAQCNLFPELCGKNYNEVSFLMNHNAYNASMEGFALGNQTFSVKKQLEDGIRGFMLDIYDLEGEVTLYHSLPGLGTQALIEVLNDMKDFMDSNPNEIITIIFESYVEADQIEEQLQSSGLMDLLFTKVDGTTWPTLQEMIDSNQRLVIFSERDNAGENQNWHHYIWDHAVETHFDNNSISDFNCDYNRGDPENDLFILNHFITEATLGVGLIDEAKIINANPYFMDRVQQCMDETSKRPNFITIDFYEEGNAFDMINTLNEVAFTSGTTNLENTRLHLFPNPTSDVLQIRFDSDYRFDIIHLFNQNGERLSTHNLANNQIVIDCYGFKAGMYYINATSSTGTETIMKKFIVLP